MSRFLLLGTNGQVGKELRQYSFALPFDRIQLDITDASALKQVFQFNKFDAVVNAAAYTDVEKAETDRDLCFQVNADAPEAIAWQCAERSIPFIHISSEFVFDGRLDRPYTETDACIPLSVYGHSKRLGEEKIIATGVDHVILRTSWVFSRQRNNFVHKIIAAAKSSEAIKVVDDQFGAPTSAGQIAEAIVRILPQLIKTRALSGIYNFTAKPAVSRFEFAKAILELSGSDTPVIPVSSDSFNTKAARPKNSCLDSTKIFDQFGIETPEWRGALKEILATDR